MRRMTKLMAAILVLTCAMTMLPRQAEASLFGEITAIVGGYEYEDPNAGGGQPRELMVRNNTDRDIYVWTTASWQVFGSGMVIPPGKQMGIYGYAPDGHYEFYIELYVYNKYKKKWVLKDIAIWGNDSVGEAIKVSRGDFRLNLWRTLR